MPTPDADVVAKLLASTPVGGVTLAQPPSSSANLFMGPVRPASGAQPGPNSIPTRAIFCLATGGPPPDPYLGSGLNLYESNVQVRIRSEQSDFAGGQTLARACIPVLQQAIPSGYISFLVQEAEPNLLGQDNQGAWEWSLNVRCRWQG